MNQARGPEGREGQPGREGAQGREGLPGVSGDEGAEGPQGERGNPGPAIPRAIKIAFIILTVIFFLTLVGFGVLVTRVQNISHDNTLLVASSAVLAKENAERIKEIQASRTASCRQTYSGIRKVFKPFLGPEATRTAEQQANIDKFNTTIDDLQAGCTKQTKPKKKKPTQD